MVFHQWVFTVSIQNGTTFDTMAEDAEKVMNPWTNWMALVNNWQQSIHLPPGCQWQ